MRLNIRFPEGAIMTILADVLRLIDAARMAGCSTDTVRRAFDAGELDGVRVPGVGRLVRRESVEAWARRRAERMAA